MAHNLAPSVNCSLDDIDLNALKVCKYAQIIRIREHASRAEAIARIRRSRRCSATRRGTSTRPRRLSPGPACALPVTRVLLYVVINLARTDNDDVGSPWSILFLFRSRVRCLFASYSRRRETYAKSGSVRTLVDFYVVFT